MPKNPQQKAEFNVTKALVFIDRLAKLKGLMPDEIGACARTLHDAVDEAAKRLSSTGKPTFSLTPAAGSTDGANG